MNYIFRKVTNNILHKYNIGGFFYETLENDSEKIVVRKLLAADVSLRITFTATAYICGEEYVVF